MGDKTELYRITVAGLTEEGASGSGSEARWVVGEDGWMVVVWCGGAEPGRAAAAAATAE